MAVNFKKSCILVVCVFRLHSESQFVNIRDRPDPSDYIMGIDNKIYRACMVCILVGQNFLNVP